MERRTVLFRCESEDTTFVCRVTLEKVSVVDTGQDFKSERSKDFPGRPVVKTPHFQCKGHKFDPWLGN